MFDSLHKNIFFILSNFSRIFKESKQSVVFALPFNSLIGVCFAIIIEIVYSLFCLWT